PCPERRPRAAIVGGLDVGFSEFVVPAHGWRCCAGWFDSASVRQRRRVFGGCLWLRGGQISSNAAAPYASKGCAERLFIVSLSQIGGSRVTNLGHPAYLRSKDTGDHNLPEKRRQAMSADRTLRQTRLVWPKLDCFKPNPDRGKRDPAATLTPRGVTACRGFAFCSRQARAVRYREMIPGVGMSGRPNPC